MKKIFAAITPIALAACGTVSEPKIQLVDTSCDWVRPIYVDKTDTLSDGTARQILSHDNKWKRFCGSQK